MSSVQLSHRHSINMLEDLNPSAPHQKCKECKECGKCAALCCGGLLTMSLIIGATGGCILYVVFVIIALGNDKDLSDNCSNSHLWYYLLVSIISFIIIRINDATFFKDDNIETGAIIIYGLTGITIQLGFSIWGSLELFEITFDENNIHNMTVTTNNTDFYCKELAESKLYTMSFVSMILQFASAALVLIILLCICMMPRYIK